MAPKTNPNKIIADSTLCYLGVQNNATSLPSFEEKGISHLMPGQVSDVPVFISQRDVDPHMKMVLASIPSFARATYEDTAASRVAYYNCFKPLTSIPHWIEVPRMSVQLSNLSQENCDRLGTLSMSQDTSQANVWAGSPPLSGLLDILKMNPKNGPFNPGTVHFNGYLAYTYLLKGYVILSSIMGASHIEGFPYVIHDHIASGDLPIKYLDGSKKTAAIPVWSNLNKDGKAVGYNGIVIGVPVQQGRTFSGRFTGLDGAGLVKDMSGVFFPYFSGLVNPDKNQLNTTFFRYFSQGLGDNENACYAGFQSIKNGLGQLASTSAGRALSHIYKVLEIAIDLNAIPTVVVVSGSYYGIVLQSSSDFKLRIYGRTFESQEFKNIGSQLSVLNKHDKALGDFVAILNTPTKSDGTPFYQFKKEDVLTSRGLVKVYNQIETIHFTTDQVEMMKMHVSRMEYNDKFPPVKPPMILAFLKFVQSGIMSQLDNYPAYIHNGFLFTDSRIKIGLGIFGLTAPSPSYGRSGARIYPFPATLEANDNNLNRDANGKRHLQYIPITFTTPQTAFDDWTHLLQKGEFRIPQPRAGKDEFTNSTFVRLRIAEEPHFSAIYDAIKEISADERVVRRAGKRGRVEEEERGPAKKAKSAHEIMAEFL